MDVTISVSVLNIVVCIAIILGCIYVMCRLIKKCHTTVEIKDSQNQIIGYKKKGSKLITNFFIIFLSLICIFMYIIGLAHVLNIILIS